MALLSMADVSIAFGGERLLDEVSLHIEQGDRACLVGRNGSGKTTLMRILSGEVEPDTGTIAAGPSLRLAYLPQAVPPGLTGTVAKLLEEAFAAGHDRQDWEKARQLDRIATPLGLDPAAEFGTLSGGMKRRALLAGALVTEPDILLLDEPTNHLDIDAIEWLEAFLRRHVPTFLFVTHDRMLLRRLATRIIELDRGRLADWRCTYDTFLERKQALLVDETARNRRLDARLSQEEVWIRQGIKARRTRDEGRVRALMAMRSERARRRELEGNARLKLQQAGRSGRLVIKATGLTFAYDTTPILDSLSTTIMRGDRVGILGPNGCGKSTLLRLLLGPHAVPKDDTPEQPATRDHRVFTFELTPRDERGLHPDEGTIRRGTKLEVAYFDQHRHELDHNDTVFNNVCGGTDSVVIGGKVRNGYSYLQDFLFTPDRARMPVHALSGGEKNRLLLAKLFTRPANLLVMDEPTNDLDVETLALLEEQLLDYSGTLLLVSHDRTFINNVVTSTLVFEGDGVVREYVGGYDDWIRQRPATAAAEREEAKAPTPRMRTRTLTNREREALRELPKRIESLEAELEDLHRRMAEPEFYREPPDAIVTARQRAEAIPAELDAAFEQWEALEAIKSAISR